MAITGDGNAISSLLETTGEGAAAIRVNLRFSCRCDTMAGIIPRQVDMVLCVEEEKMAWSVLDKFLYGDESHVLVITNENENR